MDTFLPPNLRPTGKKIYVFDMSTAYQQCSRCILDTNDDPQITFDANGVCNHCYYYDEEKRLLVLEGRQAEDRLNETLKEIKSYGEGKKYECSRFDSILIPF